VEKVKVNWKLRAISHFERSFITSTAMKIYRLFLFSIVAEAYLSYKNLHHFLFLNPENPLSLFNH